MSTGFFAALPPFGMSIVKELSGLLNDRIKFISETTKTKVYNTIAFNSLAIFLIILSFVPANSGSIGLILITAGSTLQGFNIGGFYKSASRIAGCYSPFIMGQLSSSLTLAMLVVPLIVNPLTPNNTAQEWAVSFYVIAGILIVSSVFYNFTASGELSYWAKPDYWQKYDEAKKAEEIRKTAAVTAA